MKNQLALLAVIALSCMACKQEPLPWNGPKLIEPRTILTAQDLIQGKSQPLIDMSYFAQPSWASAAKKPFSGTIHLQETEISFSKTKDYYPGENIFPKLSIDFIAHEGTLIPRIKQRISTRNQNKSYWDVIIGAGRIWHEKEDGNWDRASFPLTLTDRWMGQSRNCVATFVYQTDSISHVCLQCSQETADIDDQQLGNMNGILPASAEMKTFADASDIISIHLAQVADRIPVHPLRALDTNHEIADYFDKMHHTNAPTSLGAVLIDNTLYLHPPKTRHGDYPYPAEMRHGLYSVTKSMAGALALMYLEERYPEDDLFNMPIAPFVPVLTHHQGWKNVTFGQTLNMVTGTDGGEDAARLFSTLIATETAAQAIQNIANLGDAPAQPGEAFNYASTNLFVLSYAMQQYVIQKEGTQVNYWDLVQQNVLIPIGAANFTVLHTMEANEEEALPILAYGALPTIDEAAKIALLFANEGQHQGRQILNREKAKEIFGKTAWPGYSTNDDYRGSGYQHSFWSTYVNTDLCSTKATYMLGFGENFVVYLPSGAILFRFMDEHDLYIDDLIRRVERVYGSCEK